MPFATYTIKPNTIEQIDKVENNNLLKFISSIENLNFKKRAIFIETQKSSALSVINKKYLELNNSKQSLELDKYRLLLESLMKIINDSLHLNYDSESKIEIDFEKDLKNQFTPSLFNQFSNEVYDPSLFKDVKDFVDKFLNKITNFIHVKNQKTNKINTVYIFHKELGNYLTPTLDGEGKTQIILDKSIQECFTDERIGAPYVKKEKRYKRSYYKLNANKIKNGTEVIYNWLSSIPKNIRPNNMIILTDKPKAQTKELKALQQSFHEFLFSNSTDDDLKCNIQISDVSSLKPQWWKHKRHFVFGKELDVIIQSEFGIEITDGYNPALLNDKCTFTIVDSTSLSAHKQELKDYFNNIVEEP